MPRTNPPNSLQLAYVADDFTGATDALESLTLAGLRSVLFLAPPTAADLELFPGSEAVGVAALARSLEPDSMKAQLRPAFGALRALRPRHVHYKVCSTFDSSPEVGSIGAAIEVGIDVFRSRFVPVVVGAPALGRFCVFGNLFARFGIGTTGAIHRLDRHPSISRHPVTPMGEADLLRHLAKQTSRRSGLIDVLALDGEESVSRGQLEALVAAGTEIVLFDVLVSAHLARIGALLDPLGTSDQPLFSVGSSAVGSALASRWHGSGTSEADHARRTPPVPARPLLVASGSCSPVTARQITFALAHGFAGIRLAPDGSNEIPAASAALAALRSGRSTVVYTALEAADQTVAAAPASLVGGALGRIARAAVESDAVHRVLLAGGDSSSFAARALGIQAVEMIAPLAPGAPLCRAHAPGSAVHGIEVNVKGGQVGAEDYFLAVAAGSV